MRTLFGFLIFSLLIVLVAPRTLEWLAHQPLPPWEWQSLEDAFDCDKTRNTELHKFMFAQSPGLEEMMRDPEFYEIYPSARGGGFCFAIVDLNNDGRDDLLVMTRIGTLACGSAGCETEIYQREQDDTLKEIGSFYSLPDGTYLNQSKGNRYRKIAFYSGWQLYTMAYSEATHGYRVEQVVDTK